MYTHAGRQAPRNWDVVKVPLVESGRVVGVYLITREVTKNTGNQEDTFTKPRTFRILPISGRTTYGRPLANSLELVDLMGEEVPSSIFFEQVQVHLQRNLQQLDLVLRGMNTVLAV